MSPTGTRWNDLDVKPCGTPAAYRRHLRHGERPCESCRQAEGRRLADYNVRRPRVTTPAGRIRVAPEWDGQPAYECRREYLEEWVS